MELIHGTDTRDPLLETAISRAILRQVARGERPETLRVHATRRTVAFGIRDTRSPGYIAAVSVASRRGFTPLERLAGGRAAAFTEGTLAFSWASPDPGVATEARFSELARIMRDAFSGLGADARIGEVKGEYCPGAHSVNLSGRHKVMGVGQRIIRGAAHVGGVVVVTGRDTVTGVITPVYDALGLGWNPDTSGDLAMQLPGIDLATAADAIIGQFARRKTVHESAITPDLLEEAGRLVELSRPPGW